MEQTENLGGARAPGAPPGFYAYACVWASHRQYRVGIPFSYRYHGLAAYCDLVLKRGTKQNILSKEEGKEVRWCLEGLRASPSGKL